MKYTIKVAKYFIYLVILYLAILNIAALTGTLSLDGKSSVYQMLLSEQGVRMLCAMVVLSLLYPFFGFVKREHTADFISNREDIIRAFEVNGMRLESASEGEMTFVGATFLRRLRLLFEDRVIVRPTQNGVEFEGSRRAVSYVIYRLRI